MREAFVVASSRTPLAKSFRGSFNHTRPDDQAGHCVKDVLGKVPQLDPVEVEDVIMGCAQPYGTQGSNVARVVATRAALPVSVAGTTINRFCSSGLQAIVVAAHEIMNEGAEAAIGGGLESITMLKRDNKPNPWVQEHKPALYMAMGETAEVVAKRYKVSRQAQDEYFLLSQQRTARGQQEVRPLLHRPIPDAMGPGGELRRRRLQGRAGFRHRQCALLVSRVPHRRPAAGRDPRDRRRGPGPHPARAERRGPAAGAPPGPAYPRHRGKRSQRSPGHRPRPAGRLWAGRAVERRFPPRDAHRAHGGTQRLLHGLRVPGPAGQGVHARLRVRRPAFHVSRATPRDTGQRPPRRALCGLHPKPRPGGQPSPGAALRVGGLRPAQAGRHRALDLSLRPPAVQTASGLTGWATGEASSAAGICFKAWLEGFGGTGSREERAFFAYVRAFFEAHGASRFAATTDDAEPRVVNRAGFYRDGNRREREFLVLPEVFRREVCAGFDSRAATRWLKEHGWLLPGADGKATQKPRLKGLGPTRCYVIAPRFADGDD